MFVLLQKNIFKIRFNVPEVALNFIHNLFDKLINYHFSQKLEIETKPTASTLNSYHSFFLIIITTIIQVTNTNTKLKYI